MYSRTVDEASRWPLTCSNRSATTRRTCPSDIFCLVMRSKVSATFCASFLFVCFVLRCVCLPSGKVMHAYQNLEPSFRLREAITGNQYGNHALTFQAH